MNCDNVNDKVIGDISLRRLEKIILMISEYNVEGHKLIHEGGVSFSINRWSDYDGHPLEDMLDLYCFTSEKQSYGSESWKVTVGYSSTSGEEYDYLKKAARSNSTAYKYKPSGPEGDVKFKLDSYWFGGASPEKVKEIYSQLVRLEGLYLDLADKTKTISSWVSCGMPMTVVCRNWMCGSKEAKIISNETLSLYEKRGLSLEGLSSKLVCKKCGKNNPRLLPPVDVFGLRALN